MILRRVRAGFTLIELMWVMILLAFATGVLALLLKQTLDLERAQGDSFDKLLKTNVVVDQFRADVSQAETAPLEWEGHEADKHTLILRSRDGQHVVYLWREGVLTRVAQEGAKSTERSLPVAGGADVEFRRDAGNARVVQLHLSTLRDGAPLPGQTLPIVAALGGDQP